MEPTVTTVITWVAGALVTALVVYLFNRINTIENRHESLNVAFREHLEEVPKIYVTKDDFREDLKEIKATLNEMRNYIMGARQ